MGEIFCVLALGLVFGSFATALSYRIPREISMTAEARSRCPSCNKILRAPDLIPLFSYLFLRGRCRHCKNPIGARYALIEVATAALCISFYWFYGLTLSAVFLFMLAPVLISIVDIDLRYKIIPDSLNLAVAALAGGFFLAHTLLSWEGFHLAAMEASKLMAGALIYGAGAWLLRALVTGAVKREAMGWGDIKFFAAAGLWLGIDLDRASLFLLIAGIAGIVLALAMKRWKGIEEIPFGPSLALALAATICVYPPAAVLPF